MKVLELFAGIGGCAFALQPHDQILLAVDQSPYATEVYTHVWPEHRHTRWNLAGVKTHQLDVGADLWWMSPPCQPFTVRGKAGDVDDPRCQPLIRLLEHIAAIRPPAIALENVPGFETSRMRTMLLSTLDTAGYQVRERILCPTQLGIPMKRSRYYLVARLGRLAPWPALRPHPRRVEDYVGGVAPDVLASLTLPADLQTRFAGKLPISDPQDFPWVGCFTGAYGNSPVFAGSYWKGPRGPRYLDRSEVQRFMGFDSRLTWPGTIDRRRAWKLLGNSLSVDAVREVLQVLRR